MATSGGQPGNTNGGKGRQFYRRVLALCEQEEYSRLNKAAEKVLDEAAGGQEWAIVLLRDTLDGKPKQQTEITGADGGPVFIKTGIARGD